MAEWKGDLITLLRRKKLYSEEVRPVYVSDPITCNEFTGFQSSVQLGSDVHQLLSVPIRLG